MLRLPRPMRRGNPRTRRPESKECKGRARARCVLSRRPTCDVKPHGVSRSTCLCRPQRDDRWLKGDDRRLENDDRRLQDDDCRLLSEDRRLQDDDRDLHHDSRHLKDDDRQLNAATGPVNTAPRHLELRGRRPEAPICQLDTAGRAIDA